MVPQRRFLANLLAQTTPIKPRAFTTTTTTTTTTTRITTLRHQYQLPTTRSQTFRPLAAAAAVISTPVSVTTVTKKAYSSESPTEEGTPSKIWSFEDIQKLISSSSPSVTIIDSREPSELQETGRIPGAINVPVKSAPDSFFISDEEFEDQYGFPRPSKDTELVFYCKAGVRSRAAAGLAKHAGWQKVGEYPGSWLDWFEKGGKIER